MFDTGTYSITAQFLDTTKQLAVRKFHKAIHTLDMFRSAQQSEEGKMEFAARITGTAELFGLTANATLKSIYMHISFRPGS